MTRTEEHLAHLLHAAAPTSDGVDVDDVASRVRRRRTVRESVVAVATSLATVAVVVVLVNLGATADRRPPANDTTTPVDLTGTVPWIDTLGSAYQAPTATPSSVADAPPCTAADLTATPGASGAAAGHVVQWIQLTNTGTTACLLSGYAQVTATEPGLPDLTATDGSYAETSGAGVVRPGESGTVGVSTDSVCDAPVEPAPVYHHLDVELPGGGTIAVDLPDGFDAACGLRVTTLTGPAPSAPTRPADPQSSLHVTLDAPATVAAGHTLVYVARVSNWTDEPISLDRCPSYLQQASGATELTEDYELNCGPVGQIAAHATVRFEMRLDVPADALPGELDLAWSLAVPDAPAATAAVTVTSTHGTLSAAQRALAVSTATAEAWSSPPSGSPAPTAGAGAGAGAGADHEPGWPSNVNRVTAIATTHADAMQYVGGGGDTTSVQHVAAAGDTTSVLVIRLVGDFSWVTSGPPGHGPVTGNVMTIVIDAHTGAITDTGLEAQDPPRPLPDATVLYDR